MQLRLLHVSSGKVSVSTSEVEAVKASLNTRFQLSTLPNWEQTAWWLQLKVLSAKEIYSYFQ